jgi:hypothetical protein
VDLGVFEDGKNMEEEGWKDGRIETIDLIPLPAPSHEQLHRQIIHRYPMKSPQRTRHKFELNFMAKFQMDYGSGTLSQGCGRCGLAIRRQSTQSVERRGLHVKVTQDSTPNYFGNLIDTV